MDNLPGKAILVVDMINDFTTGRFGSQNAMDAVKKAENALSIIHNIPIIFACDAHIKNDPEFAVWGEHAIEGTYGAEIVDGLKKYPDFVIKKRHFDAFYDSGLDSLLRSLHIANLYIFGISTDICVLHTCAGAFYRYYNAKVVSGLCASIDETKHQAALENIKINYGYKAISYGQFINELS
ncbi:MAG: isochorismatase family cysteine hydrolase [Ferroplasma sp.]